MAAKQQRLFFKFYLFLVLALHNTTTASALSCSAESVHLFYLLIRHFASFLAHCLPSLPKWVSQVLFVRSKWLCVQRQRERRNAWETERCWGIRELRGGGGSSVAPGCGDVTSVVGRRDGINMWRRTECPRKKTVVLLTLFVKAWVELDTRVMMMVTDWRRYIQKTCSLVCAHHLQDTAQATLC